MSDNWPRLELDRVSSTFGYLHIASQMLGNVVYDNVGVANNLPFAAAMATVPVVIILTYLALVRRTGALENL